jgi:Fe-S-cluster-containing dehydrogenase component
MQSGFIFNHNKCVACGACRVGCIIENDWTIHVRSVFTFNSDAFTTHPLINLSLACNHCETAVCLDGCPTGTFQRDEATGAVLFDTKKCIGCRYCQWNCPYDAPKFDPVKKTILKCNLCYSGLTEGRSPACTSACPTGALNWGDLGENYSGNKPSLFPDKNLNPSIEFKGPQNPQPSRIIPGKIYVPVKEDRIANSTNIISNWSLFVFSFLSTISVSIIISSLINGCFPDAYLTGLLIVIAGVVSLFHLGKWIMGWSAVTNIKTSPLSREIAIFIFFSLLTLTSLFIQIPVLLLLSSITGLLLLVAIDSVYIYTDKRWPVILHSGQTFLSGLLIISFFSESIIPFIFIALIKLGFSGYRIFVIKSSGKYFGIRFLRIAILIVICTSLITGISYNDPATKYLFLSGELFDRIIFYIDFDPLNINRLITKQFFYHEKKRD